MTYVAFIAPPAASGGGEVTYSFSNPGQSVDISQSGTLSKFDTSLGTLTAAVLTLSFGFSTHYRMTLGAAGSPQLCAAIYSAEGNFSSSLSALNSILGAGQPNVSLDVSTGVITMSPNTVNDVTGTPSGTAVVDLSSILASLQASGGGTFTISAYSFSSFAAGGGGGYLTTADLGTTAFSGASITYTYT